jgi:hypothetical protein
VEVERALDEATGGDFEDHDYLNKTLTKRELDAFIGEPRRALRPEHDRAALDVIKSGHVPLRDPGRASRSRRTTSCRRVTRRRSSPGSRTRSRRSVASTTAAS